MVFFAKLCFEARAAADDAVLRHAGSARCPHDGVVLTVGSDGAGVFEVRTLVCVRLDDTHPSAALTYQKKGLGFRVQGLGFRV